MSDWTDMILDDVATIEIGGTPSRDISAYWAGTSDSGFPWVSIADLQKRVITETKERITEKGISHSNVKPIREGTLIISFKLSIGRAALAGMDLFTNEAIAAITPKDKRIHAALLYYVLPDVAKNAITDTAVKGATLNKSSLGKLTFRVPIEYKQQEKIAKILSTIDRTITHTEALIEKYQQIKAGLMHDLFTRGIGAEGKLRPPRDKAPELYRESSIGWIPKEWKLSILRDYLIDNPTNGIYKSPDQIGDGTLMIGQTAFTRDRSIDFNLCRRGLISEAEERKYNVSENNILITRVFATVDGVGLPTLVPQMHEKAVFESNMMRLRIDDSKIAPLILFEWLRGSKVRKLIVSGANASNQVSVNQKTLNILPVPLIGGDEQSRIVDSISTHNRRYLIEKMYLDKLKKQKSGLMHDLLTGTVRVNSDPV